jgi:hypothetical protein
MRASRIRVADRHAARWILRMKYLCTLARIYLLALAAALVAFTVSNWLGRGHLSIGVVWYVWFNPMLRWVTLAALALAVWGHFSP